MAIGASKIRGEISAPPSKSYTHRAIICASLADGKSTIHNPLLSEDTEATLEACKALGAVVLKKSREEIIIQGTNGILRNKKNTIDCKESGSTLRFILPLAAMSQGETILTGSEGLVRRPIVDLLDAVEKLGVKVEYMGKERSLPIKLSGMGKINGGKIKIRGDISSQFISGLLFALPLARGKSEIRITTEEESVDYIEMTIDALAEFSVTVEKSREFNGYIIEGGQTYVPKEYRIEGDFSSAAFMLVAGALSAEEGAVTVNNLRADSKQGDRKIVDILKDMGADIEVSDTSVMIKKSPLKGTIFDAKNVPDLVPIIAIASTQASSPTIMRNVNRLRMKESDRLSGLLKLIGAFGCEANEKDGSLTIRGGQQLFGGEAPLVNDHRIVMAASVAGLIAKGETRIGYPLAIKKSYPDFFDDLRSLGGDIMTVSNVYGNFLELRLLGESHGKRIGSILKGVPSGVKIQREFIQSELEKRRSINQLTTTRREEDAVEIVSGIESDETTGETIRLEIRNRDVKSEAYERTKSLIRPGHADYTAREKYASVFDYRGGGFLSGRMTACLVAAGAIAKKVLETQGIKVLAHTISIGDVKVTKVLSDEDVERNRFSNFVRCADLEKAKEMERAIEEVKREGDSLGGIIECRIIGLPLGVGEPIFHSIESDVSHSIFAIPAVKGIEFGSGFKGSDRKGSENNDPFAVKEGKVVTLTNNSGGILGGISNGMPVVFRVAIKPTSSIAKEQQTIDYEKLEGASLSIKGRHDPCIAVRAPPVVEAMTALTITDLMMAGGFIRKS
jgi:chorismate synthase